MKTRKAARMYEVVEMNEAKNQGEQNERGPNFRLLLERMTSLVMSGRDMDKQIRVLKKPAIWKKLDPDQALEWSRLAQIAGETGVALEMLEHIHDVAPQFKEGWKEHFQLLLYLEQRSEAMKVRARAIKHLPEIKDELSEAGDASLQEEDMEEQVEDPFAKMKRTEELLRLYMELFQGRENCFARQWAEKENNRQGYVPVRRPMGMEDVRDHIKGGVERYKDHRTGPLSGMPARNSLRTSLTCLRSCGGMEDFSGRQTDTGLDQPGECGAGRLCIQNNTGHGLRG